MKYPSYQTIKYYSKTIILIILNYGLRDAIKFVSDYRIIKNLIREKILLIVPKYKVDNPGASYKKYLDISYWLFESMRRFYFLGLHRGQKLRILDIVSVREQDIFLLFATIMDMKPRD